MFNQSLITIVIMLGVLFISRDIVCWYWKTNETLAVLKEIRDLLKANSQDTDYKSIYPEPHKDKTFHPDISDTEQKNEKEVLRRIKNCAGEDAITVASVNKTEWICICGTHNPLNDQNCYKCHRNKKFTLKQYSE